MDSDLLFTLRDQYKNGLHHVTEQAFQPKPPIYDPYPKDIPMTNVWLRTWNGGVVLYTTDINIAKPLVNEFIELRVKIKMYSRHDWDSVPSYFFEEINISDPWQFPLKEIERRALGGFMVWLKGEKLHTGNDMGVLCPGTCMYEIKPITRYS